jgi:nicotinamidase-related amidase
MTLEAAVELGSPYAPGSPGHRFKASAMPLDGEPVVGKTANSAFIGPALESMLDELGATTLVLCGVLRGNAPPRPRRGARAARTRI